MKFYNKNLKYRKTWIKVDGPVAYKSAEVKKWCQQNDSPGRFYFSFMDAPSFDHGENRPFWPWYFENSQDATAFKLMWSGK